MSNISAQIKHTCISLGNTKNLDSHRKLKKYSRGISIRIFILKVDKPRKDFIFKERILLKEKKSKVQYLGFFRQKIEK